MTKEDIYDQTITKIHATLTDPEEIRRAELAALVELGLGFPLERRVFDTLDQHNGWLRKAQEKLAARLEGSEINPDEYLAAFDKLTRFDEERGRAILGDKYYEAIFGNLNEPDGLYNRETFHRQFPLSPEPN